MLGRVFCKWVGPKVTLAVSFPFLHFRGFIFGLFSLRLHPLPNVLVIYATSFHNHNLPALINGDAYRRSRCRSSAQSQVRMEMYSALEMNAELPRNHAIWHQPYPQNKKKKKTCINEGDYVLQSSRWHPLCCSDSLFFIVVKLFCWILQNTNFLRPGDSFFAELLDEHVSFIASKTVKESSLCAKTMIQSDIKSLHGADECSSWPFHNLLWYNIKIWIGEF